MVKQSWILKQDAGDGKMKEISDHIYEGALAFLNAEYRLLTIFVLIVSIILAGISFIVPTTHILIVVSFIFGAFFSAFAGNIGMKIATKTITNTITLAAFFSSAQQELQTLKPVERAAGGRSEGYSVETVLVALYRALASNCARF